MGDIGKNVEVPVDKDPQEPGLTPAEQERIDFVDNACHHLLCELAGRELEWDMENIGGIADVAEGIICDKLHLMTSREFKPYIGGGE